MKARILALLALVLGVVSCQTEPEGLDVNVGGEVETTVCVSLPEATRANSALGAFDNVDLTGDATIRYILKIYQKVGEEYKASLDRQVEYSDGKSVVFPVRLVPNRDYRFVVWADYVESEADVDFHYNTEDLTNITLNGEWKSMDETRDAFTGYYCTVEANKQYTSTSSINITLKRPFAKLRVVTTDMQELANLGITPAKGVVNYTEKHYAKFNALTGVAFDRTIEKTHQYTIKNYEKGVLFVDYFFANDDVMKFNLDVMEANDARIKYNDFSTDIFVKRNYLTTIQGNILTDGNNVKVDVEDAFAGNVDYDSDKDEQTTTVNTANDFVAAVNSENIDVVVLNGDIDLNDLLTRANSDLTLTVSKALTIDLNGNTLSATSAQTGKNYDMFFVTNGGDLTVKNGNIVYEHLGENMGWNNCTDIFRVSFSGKLTLESVTAENNGGSDMAYVVDMSNATNLFVNIDNSILKSTYIPVRVFNNNGKHNVTIENTTLEGKYCFWVQYWLADGRNQATLDETLNISIYNLGNTFTYTGASAVIYGFNETIYANDCGITKTVSEDGTVVTLGSMTDNGIVHRGVAGAEENTTITKAVVGEGITTLYDRTFRRYYALETVVLPSTLTTIGAAGSGVFQSCNALKNIVIPESVTVLGEGSFQECSSLESINIPAGVTRIEKNTFNFSGIKSVEFHEGVTYFGAQAFRDCKQLTEVVINAPEFTMEGNTFGIMAAPFTPMTIHVANTEMKAYVESKLTDHAKTYITVKAPATVTDKASLQAKMAEAIKAGEKNIYIDGTNFSGDLNYGFSNANLPAGVTVTIRNAKVTATSKWNYLNGKLVFENCEFTAGLYSIHFDDNDGVGDVVFKNCKLVGWLPFAAINSVTFEGCHLTGNGSYALIRSYADLTLKNCVIDTTLANHTDEYTDGVQVIEATLTEENVTYIDNHTAYLQNVLKAGKHVVLSSDLTINEGEMLTAPYGNKMALHHNGGLFDGNNKTLSVTIGGDHYAVMTSGGTIKDLTVNNGFRGVLIMYPKETIYLDNVVSSGEGVCYALNTAEGDSTQDLVATNCTFDGWCSWSLLKSATFTNCTFGQGTYYTNVYGRLGKPYVNTVFDGCNFCSKYYIDLSAFVGTKVVVKNCTVNGVKITAENWTSLVAPESTCGEGQISVELKDGTYLTAENVADYIVFE